MKYITTTALRTQSTQLIDSLKRGKKVSLLHRSQVVGEIVPVEADLKVFDLKKFREFIPTPQPEEGLSPKERERRYRKHLEEKYGKDFS